MSKVDKWVATTVARMAGWRAEWMACLTAEQKVVQMADQWAVSMAGWKAALSVVH